MTSSLDLDENSNEIATSLLSSPLLDSNGKRPDDDVDDRANNESLIEQAVNSIKREITFEKQNEEGEDKDDEDVGTTKKMEYAFGSSFDKTERSNSLISERSRKHSQSSRKSSIKTTLDDEPHSKSKETPSKSKETPSKSNETPSKSTAKPLNKAKKKRKSTKKSINVENESTVDVNHREETQIAPPQQQQQQQQVVNIEEDKDISNGENQVDNEDLSNSKDSLESPDRYGTLLSFSYYLDHNSFSCINFQVSSLISLFPRAHFGFFKTCLF